MMDDRNRERLEHMLKAISTIETYASGLDEDGFPGNPMIIDAIERNIERISEASRHLPDDLEAKHPVVPWREIAGIGNILRHDYPQVRPAEIWATVVGDLPLLKATIGAILREG